MRLWRRFIQRECPPEVLEGLYAVGREYPDCTRWRECHLFYAHIGRDRAKLTMEWVEDARQACESEQEFNDLLASIARGNA